MQKLRFAPIVWLAGLAICAMNASRASADLVGYYPLDGNLNDASGHGNNGTPGPTAPTFTTGFTGQGAQFSGTDGNQFFTVPININPSVMPQVTFGGWIKPDGNNPRRGIISNDTGGFRPHH